MDIIPSSRIKVNRKFQFIELFEIFRLCAVGTVGDAGPYSEANYGEKVCCTFLVDDDWTFNELFNAGYLPYTCKELVDPAPLPKLEVIDPVSKYDFSTLLTGKLQANRQIERVIMTITDENGNQLQQGTAWNYRTNHEGSNLRMHYDLEFTEVDGKKMAVCPVCGGDPVEWTELPEISAHTSFTASHYYVAKDLSNKARYNLPKSSTICVHLNGHNITSTSQVFWLGGSLSMLNVMGNGIVKGSYTSEDNVYGATMHFSAASANVSLYGGAYGHCNSSAKPTVVLGASKPNLTIYSGATFCRMENAQGAHIEIRSGTVDLRGGRILGGTNTTGYGGNIFCSSGNVVKLYADDAITLTGDTYLDINGKNITATGIGMVYGKMPIYANTYVELADGTIVMCENSAEQSLYDVLAAIDENWTDYEENQASILDFFRTWATKGLSSWEFTNIK